ncbi:sigma-70 family RNA polymerase sigma factor [Sphingomonadaceae bacterium jetA1]|jgi:RNA polymerase sigma-70 factor (ECF subfamily)|uniref:sigma-70 family RNA polymerase sigma factor n=1 Tax=Facivitalis istanbulensis TaxID=3075838 RepID=UPI00348C0B02
MAQLNDRRCENHSQLFFRLGFCLNAKIDSVWRLLKLVPPPSDLSSSAFYRAHREALVEYANRIVRDPARAEDVVQDAWVRVSAVDRGRSIAEPLGYFYRVVRNLALDRYRERRREIMHESHELAKVAETAPDTAPSQEAISQDRQELRLVIASLDELPERTRRAVMLYKFDGLKLREVAERMGISVALANNLVLDGVEHCALRVARRP